MLRQACRRGDKSDNDHHDNRCGKFPANLHVAILSPQSGGRLRKPSHHFHPIEAIFLLRNAICVDSGRLLGHTSSVREQDCAHRGSPPQAQTCLKKSLPLSSTRMNAGKSSTSIFQTASMPSSGYSSRATFYVLSSQKRCRWHPDRIRRASCRRRWDMFQTTTDHQRSKLIKCPNQVAI